MQLFVKQKVGFKFVHMHMLTLKPYGGTISPRPRNSANASGLLGGVQLPKAQQSFLITVDKWFVCVIHNCN